MLQQIAKETVIDALQQDLPRHCGEIIEIEQSSHAFYIDPSLPIAQNRLVEYAIRNRPAYEIVAQDTVFLEEALSFIQKTATPPFSVYLPSEYTLAADRFAPYTATAVSAFTDLILPEGYIPAPPRDAAGIVTLTPHDEELAARFTILETLAGRPDFETLFRVIVLQQGLPDGKIIAVVRDGNIIAYLSYYRFAENVYDIDHVYVLPPYRGQRIGATLVQQYVCTIIAEGGIPRYGNAENETSRRLACSVGFIPVKSQRKYSITA